MTLGEAWRERGPAHHSRLTNLTDEQSEGSGHPVIDPELLLQAYRLGVFPMALPNDEIGWFSPDPRTILPLENFHVPHGLRRERRKQQFEVRINTSFIEVMRACAARADTWINDEIIASYARLHELGFAHSLETWSPNELAGGLYGVAIGGAFFGESMFHRAAGASKVALWALVERLRAREFALLDTQWLTPHLAQFGAREIPRTLYLHLLNAAIEMPRTFAGE
jgi:leucyl/phenylalanyl-tRNA--protein transferase